MIFYKSKQGDFAVFTFDTKVIDVLGIEKASIVFVIDTKVEVIEETKYTMSDLKELGLYKLTKGKNAGIWLFRFSLTCLTLNII